MPQIEIALYTFVGSILCVLFIQVVSSIWMIFSVWYEGKYHRRSKFDIRTWFEKI
jgi:hypothetical protein